MLRDLPVCDLLPLVQRLADVALEMDSEGDILRVSVFSEELPESFFDDWPGSRFHDRVLPADQRRVEEALAALAGSDDSAGDDKSGSDALVQRCDVSHDLPSARAPLPVQYQLYRVTDRDRVIALGRDMRPVATLRNQLLNAQQALEQDYWRLRQLETRYRRLFDMVGDGVLIVDALSNRVLEANPRANDLLGGGERALIGKVFPRGFAADAEPQVQDMLRDVRTSGREERSSLALTNGEGRVDLVASYLRQGGEERFLLRLGLREAAAVPSAGALLLQEALRLAPDGVLLLETDGRIAAVNRSFVELAQLRAEEQAVGQFADRWLGRSSVDLNVLLSNLREHPAVKLFASTLLPEGGSPLEVEVSACRLEEPKVTHFALFIRDIGRRVARDYPVASQLPRSIEQVTQRVGRVPLKDLVRESTDIIEALCIETALEVTGDNRASAAELLGLSRQSLYAKLRRFNIGGETV